MLIPHGTTVHEHLASSYVRIAPLVDDLCEGGFSGLVELALRDVEGFIVIAGGRVGAVLVKRNQDEYDRSTVSQLAEQARAERGLIAIRKYSTQTAEAVAGRINAQSLYARLSVEFTDLETMLKKLVREADRDWFVDVNTDAGISVLIHVHDRSFHVITSRHGCEDEWDAQESADDAARKKLLYECKRAAGTFDVYFKDLAGPSEAAAPVEPDVFASDSDALRATPVIEPAAKSLEEPSASVVSAQITAATPAHEVSSDFASVGDEVPLIDGDAMTELKRLMGEIAGTIEGAAQAVDRRDGFGMCLRASQLKIAERYPFLDPFASEFEYLAGEIVFVGDATAEQFVAGLTEALGLAIQSLAESNAYGERFRAYVKEDLAKLLARNRTELESYGLDRVIEEIAG